MMKNRGRGTVFSCFTPTVMIITFLVEFGYLLYILIRYKMNTLARLVSLLIVLLATFQLAEYFVCEGSHLNVSIWSRIGFVAITLLPPVVIHILHTIAKKPWNNITGAAYGMAAAWIVVFTFLDNAFQGHECTGNYVIFQLLPGLGGLYFFHYYMWLFIGAYLSYIYARRLKNKDKKSLYMLGIGFAVLLIPTTTVNLIKPETLQGLPSIMCGFAVIFASILVFGVLPRSGKKRKSK